MGYGGMTNKLRSTSKVTRKSLPLPKNSNAMLKGKRPTKKERRAAKKS